MKLITGRIVGERDVSLSDRVVGLHLLQCLANLGRHFLGITLDGVVHEARVSELGFKGEEDARLHTPETRARNPEVKDSKGDDADGSQGQEADHRRHRLLEFDGAHGR